MTFQKLCFFITIMCTISQAFSEDYQIKLSREVKVGLKYKLTVSCESLSDNSMSVGTQVLKSTKRHRFTHFEGILTVAKVDQKKKAIEYNVVVNKCTKKKKGDDKETEVLPSGTKLVAKRVNAKKVFLIDNKPVAAAVSNVLKKFFSYSSKVSDDDVFGAKERKKIGDHWPVSRQNVVKGLARKGLKLNPAHVTGSTKVVQKVNIDGIDCLKILAKMSAKTPAPNLTKGFHAEKSTISVKVTSSQPIDTNKLPLSTKMTTTLNMVIKGKKSPDGPEVTYHTFSKSTKRLTRKPLK